MALTISTVWRDRLCASLIHLSISLCIAALAAVLVFFVWYPYPYRDISGGRELFLIVVAVDIALGPLITLVVFNRAKPSAELRRDIAVVALLQLIALTYGLWTVSMARPVHLVFEYDRFRVVHAIEVPPELMDKVPEGISALPLTGPTLLSLRDFKNGDEKMTATLAALQGMQLSARPDLWQSYKAGVPEILKAAKSTKQLSARFPNQAPEIEQLLRSKGRNSDDLVYLPLIGRKSYWTVFLDPVSAEVVAVFPLDSF